MELFYKPKWFPTTKEITLFAAEVYNSDKIKKWDDLEPYLIEEIENLVKKEMNDPNLENTLEDHLGFEVIQTLPGQPTSRDITLALLYHHRYQSEIHKLIFRINGQDEPKKEELISRSLAKDLHQERNLFSILEYL